MQYYLPFSLICCLFVLSLCHYPEHRHRRLHHGPPHRHNFHGNHHGGHHHHHHQEGYYDHHGYHDPAKYYETHAINDNWIEGNEETKVVAPANYAAGSNTNVAAAKSSVQTVAKTDTKAAVVDTKVNVQVAKSNGANSVGKSVVKKVK